MSIIVGKLYQNFEKNAKCRPEWKFHHTKIFFFVSLQYNFANFISFKKLWLQTKLTSTNNKQKKCLNGTKAWVRKNKKYLRRTW